MPWAPEGFTEAISIGDLLLRAAQRTPDGDALVFPDERVTYAQLAQRARHVARGLIGAGLAPGEKVGYLMANSVETVATFYGIALAGGVIVPINTRYRARELPFVVSNAELAMIVTSDRIDDYVDLLALLDDPAYPPITMGVLAHPRFGEVDLSAARAILNVGPYRDPEKNAVAFDADGWLHTGDRGSLDEEGRVKFLGRLKEMLKVGGENVAAVEIESHISTHPAVKLVQVVGVPDERLWEVPVACFELRPGASASEEDIVEHCRGAIASFKVPRHVRFVTESPMSASKIQKHRLRETLLADL